MRLPFALLVCALVHCRSDVRSERPAATPDASALHDAEEPAVPSVDGAAEPSTTAPAGDAAPPSAASSAPAPAASSLPEIERRPCRVALIGDSLTDPPIGGGYVRYLEKLSPMSRFVSFAKGGAMVNQMKRQLDAMLADPEGRFTHLLVFGGVNDLYSDETAGRTVRKIEADLGALYAAGRARGLRVVGVTVAPWGGFSRWYNERRGAATRELNAWILAGPTRGELDVAVDAYALLSCGDPERLCARYALAKSDGLHFGKVGHEVLGKALYDSEFNRCP